MSSFYLDDEEIGEICSYYSQVGAAAIKLHGSIKIGDKIRIMGKTTNFIQVVESMEHELKPVTEGVPNQLVGIKLKYKCRTGDKVYKVHEF